MRQRILASIVALLATASAAGAQAAGPIDITANDVSGVCTTAASCATFALNDTPLINLTLDVAGTWTGTLTFQATVNGTDWRTILATNVATGATASTTTAGGTFSIANVGYQAVRARATAAMTGTANVYMRRGYTRAENLAPSVTTLTVPDGGTGTPAIVSSSPTSGYGFVQGNPAITNTGVFQLGVFSGQLQLRTDTLLGWATTNVNTLSDTWLGRGGGAGKLTLTGTTPMFQFGGTTSSFPALKKNTNSQIRCRLADDSGDCDLAASIVTMSTSLNVTNTMLLSATAPSAPSACGTSPAIGTTNGTGAFTIVVGTGGTASSCTWAMPAATTGWVCDPVDITTQSTNVFHQKQTAGTTTSVTVTNYNTAGAATAFVASDTLRVKCAAY